MIVFHKVHDTETTPSVFHYFFLQTYLLKLLVVILSFSVANKIGRWTDWYTYALHLCLNYIFVLCQYPHLLEEIKIGCTFDDEEIRAYSN